MEEGQGLPFDFALNEIYTFSRQILFDNIRLGLNILPSKFIAIGIISPIISKNR